MLDLLSSLIGFFATKAEFNRPPIDWHAIAPELCLLGGGAIVTLIDVIWRENCRSEAGNIPRAIRIGSIVTVSRSSRADCFYADRGIWI